MKILLREHSNTQYVWKTAKYHNNSFHVGNIPIPQHQVVSIMNDNRKKYIHCSCCGEVFRKGDRRFEIHKENAIKPETCFSCPHLAHDNPTTIQKKYKINEDGAFDVIYKQRVGLVCTKCSMWSSYDINSERAIQKCSKRQCANATEVEIDDFFTQYPGAFDDIITIDRLLDDGYDVGPSRRGNAEYDLIYNEEYEYYIGACINQIGIVDCFFVWYKGCIDYVYYSKKYDELFQCEGDYLKWDVIDMSADVRSQIKQEIAQFYH